MHQQPQGRPVPFPIPFQFPDLFHNEFFHPLTVRNATQQDLMERDSLRQERSKNAPATTGAVHLGNDQHLY